MATQSSILAWRIPRTEEPAGLQSMGTRRVRYNCVTNMHTLFRCCYYAYYYLHYYIDQLLLYRDIQGEGNGNPLQYSCLENPMGRGAWQAAVHGVAKSQTQLSNFTFTFHFPLSCIGEGNGNPLQCSCLEKPREGGAWWAAVYGVAQSRTRLKQLSSSSRDIQNVQILGRVSQVSQVYFLSVPLCAFLTVWLWSFAGGVVICNAMMIIQTENIQPSPSVKRAMADT